MIAIKSPRILCVLAILSCLFFIYPSSSNISYAEISERCKGLEGQELLECKYPAPEIGAWKAVYSEELANEYNLPKENIKKDMPKGLAYIEMAVPKYITHNDNGRYCPVNMLVEKPNNIAFVNMKLYKDTENLIKINQERKLLQLINIDNKKDKLKMMTSSNLATRNYNIDEGAAIAGFAYYIDSVLPGYDYLTNITFCDSLSDSYGKYFPDKFSVWLAKASVWGKYESNFEWYNAPNGQKHFDSYFGINIPEEIISTVFKGVPISEDKTNEEILRRHEPERCRGIMLRVGEGSNLKCEYPDPPIGRWKAVYTDDFAKKYNLPIENISEDFSSGVDYMEMDVRPYGRKDGVACLVNMLIKRPNDISFSKHREQYEGYYSWSKGLNEKRKLAHLLDLEKYKDTLKNISFFDASRDYVPEISGFMQSTFGFYVENVLDGYDYLTVNYHCSNISMHPGHFPKGYALMTEKRYHVKKKNEGVFGYLRDILKSKGDEYRDLHLFINIPHELVSEIFKDVPIGGE